MKIGIAGGGTLTANLRFLAMRQHPALSEPEQLSPREQEAVAILTSGASFADAMRITGLSLEDAQAAWDKRRQVPAPTVPDKAH